MKSRIILSEEGDSIIKYCRSSEECANELRIYNLQLDFTPKLIKIINDNTIEISRIRGSSLSDKTDFNFSIPGKLLSRLHRSLKLEEKVICHLDTNPRNYLIEEETGAFFLIDFSESYFSLPENDLVNFLLFWAAILPSDHFQPAMRDFLAGYDAPELLKMNHQELLSQYIDIFDERRIKYCKTPGTVFEWQKNNRGYLLSNFYPILATKRI